MVVSGLQSPTAEGGFLLLSARSQVLQQEDTRSKEFRFEHSLSSACGRGARCASCLLRPLHLGCLLTQMFHAGLKRRGSRIIELTSRRSASCRVDARRSMQVYGRETFKGINVYAPLGRRNLPLCDNSRAARLSGRPFLREYKTGRVVGNTFVPEAP